MKDLNRNKRISYYWWRRNKDTVMFVLLGIVFIMGFVVLPALGVYNIS
jgi:hypothetical protein